MTDTLSISRRKALIKLESILGDECYNGSIQNYGPGGTRQAAGRSFRYPLMVRQSNGTKLKIRSSVVPDTVTDVDLRSGYYAFGANQLDVVTALEKMLQYLEQHHGLVLKDGG